MHPPHESPAASERTSSPASPPPTSAASPARRAPAVCGKEPGVAADATGTGDGAPGPHMASLRISKRTVEGLSVEDRDAIFWDRELLGFGVRVYPSGAKVYVVQSRSRGRSTRVTVGRHGVLSAARARQRAAFLIARNQGRRGAASRALRIGSGGRACGHGGGPRATVFRAARGGALQAVDPALLPERRSQMDPAVVGRPAGDGRRARARRGAPPSSSRHPVPGEPGGPHPEQDVRPGRGMGPAGRGVAPGSSHPQVQGAQAGDGSCRRRSSAAWGGSWAKSRPRPRRGEGRRSVPRRLRPSGC